MRYILFNPLSSHGKSKKYLYKIEKKLKKRNEEYKVINILDTKLEIIKNVFKEDDSLILFGGDGTIHTLINEIADLQIKSRVFVYKAGSGNDFFRDFKGKIVEVTKMIDEFPRIKYNDHEEIFINGVGSGIDAAVCNAHASGEKGGYFRKSVQLFKKFKQFEIEVTLDDGRVIKYDDTWFVTVQHGRFFGGGMKLSPKSKRDDKTLEVCMIHRVKLGVLLFIFPLIFLGWHLLFKRVGIEIIKTSKAHIKTKYPMLQRDGEVVFDILEFDVYFKE